MNLHRKHRPYLTIQQRKKLVLTGVVVLLLAWAALVFWA